MVGHPGKERFCFNCGCSMGFIEDRHYDWLEGCGELECQRAERDAHQREREETSRGDRWGGIA